ncbi:UDP-glucosyltransferase 2 [Pseudolycoriella hygida]|uniref:UDP-glucosyltransferase 2 n=1 Tax=Pseudolycoriella hygida TaxID=35572 RepID=A0A9Q0N4X9_9DIPT|nr:UDP-glucosyltransferase 2 [Pseudolycoriella hygida]
MKFGILTLISMTLALCQIIPTAQSANIAFFFGMSSYSHRVPAWPLAETLADKGHKITFISPYPAKNPNPKIFDYVPKGLKAWLDNLGDVFHVIEERKKKEFLAGFLNLPSFGVAVCDEIYKDEEYVNWVKSSKFDIVVLDALANDCGYGMAYYWGAKVILFDTTAPFVHFPEAHGTPDETSWIPSMQLFYPLEMSFSQRITNALLPIFWYYNRKWTFFPQLEAITKERLGIHNLPKFEELERNVSLVFTNSHYGEEFTRSLPPNVIPIGGIAYSEQRKPLPTEMSAFFDKGDGFIYFSFGSFANFFQLDKSTQQVFIGAMQKLSHIQFLWKVDDTSLMKEFPNNNVFISKWMPQQDILAHPKIRAFITHSGLLGIQEAIYNSVPLISFPIFAEQDYNAERIHRREYGIRLEILNVTQAELEKAIESVLTDDKYRKNMEKISVMFRERPQKPLDTALWWTEFVIRHSQEDLAALRPLSVGQSWWKRRQLDVWATVFASVLVCLWMCVYVIYLLVKCAYRINASTSSSSKPNRRKKVQ